MCHNALLRAGALATATTAMAAETFEASPEMLEATAALANSLHWDLWISVSS